MEAGKLNRYVVIQTNTPSRDASGADVASWATLASVWAEKVMKSGKEAIEGDQQVASNIVEWRIYHRTDVTAEERIYWDSNYYDILSVEEIGHKEGLLLRTERKEEIPVSYCTETDAILDAFATEPNNARKEVINNLVQGLKADGIWTRLDCLWVFASHDGTDALVNFINPGTFDCTLVNAPSFVADQGYTGASTKYIRSNYIPSSNATNYALNFASLGVYIRTNLSGFSMDIGARDDTPTGSYFAVVPNYNNISYLQVNAGASGTVANTDSRGFYIGSRITSSTQILYRNGVSVESSEDASTRVMDKEVYILCRNENGTPSFYSLRQVSIAFIGGGLTAGDATNFNTRVEAYMDALGTGVQ